METETTSTIAVILFFTFALFLFCLVHLEPKRGFIIFTVKFQEINDKSNIIHSLEECIFFKTRKTSPKFFSSATLEIKSQLRA